jgi:hypothetical protein
MTFMARLNASVCPVKNIPGVPARINIYFVNKNGHFSFYRSSRYIRKTIN